MTIFTAYRFYSPVEFPHSTLAKAVEHAFETLHGDDAWPEKIVQDGMIVWEQSGPMKTHDSLVEFARKNGIPLETTP